MTATISSRRAGSRGALLAVLTCTAAAPLGAQVTAETYARADRLLPTNADQLVLRDKVRPNWIAGGPRFWYRVTTPSGAEFVYVDPVKRVRRTAFDHAKLAAALGAAAETTLVADSLPFETLEWKEEGKQTRVVVSLRGKSWACDVGTYRCDTAAAAKPVPGELPSPDGRWALSIDKHNLWIRNTATGERRQLTADGTTRNDYATNPESNTSFVTAQRMGAPTTPIALWSADSRRILTHRLDQRAVPESYLVQSVRPDSVRPKLWTFAFPFPGDSLSKLTWWVFDAESGKGMVVNGPAMPVGYQVPQVFQEVWWHDSAGTKAYYLEHERGVKALWLREVDAAAGTVRTVVEERGQTLVEANLSLGAKPNVHVTKDGREVVWFSERDGWAHLYLVDAQNGRVVNAITKGEWVVRQLLRVDDKARRVWFTVGGREPGQDPYLRHVYSVSFDGSNLVALTPDSADHDVTLSPDGTWAVDRVSRSDLAPITVLRSLDGGAPGSALMLEQADITRLLATGWRMPERFVTKAADGTIDIYGIIVRPSNFDSTRKYPILDEIYPGPQVNKVPKTFEAGGDQRALVELGFIGIEVDGRGTPFRSKAFHDYSYGKLENGGGLEDHVAATQALAATRPWMDLSRVGIYGHSGGGFASARAMFMYPDFYKVAVSSSGNHDQRGYLSLWGETYHGMPNGDNYAAQVNASIAKNLKGHILLAYGDLDDNVPPALTLQVVDALEKANKNYDLLVITNGNHAMVANPYFRRRRWDYFVEHLLGEKPPRDYQITAKPEYPLP